jgi:hypothetical protein
MILKTVITGLLAACFLGMHCMTLPTQTESQSYQIKLSLEISGRYSAEFSGEPIKAIIETKDSVLFNSIAWHTGKGTFSVPDSIIGKKGRQFIAYLSWKTYPLKRDSISKQYSDSIFVSIGGGLKQSNTVVVKVTNLPVVFDSLKMKDTVFTGTDMVWKYNTVDSQKTISFTLYTRDLDGGNATVTASDRLNALSPGKTSQFTFTVPSGDYVDTSNFIISDGKGGQVICMLVLSHLTPNTPPEFDSLVINKQSITGTDKILKIAFTSFDTLHMRFYAHDKNEDSIKVLWSAGMASRLKRDSTNTQNATYICSTCQDTVNNTTFVVDTLTIKFFDAKKDTLTKKLVIYKGKLNLKPEIVSLKVGDTILKGNDSIFVISLKGAKEYPLQDSVSDPDNDSLTSTWLLKETSRIKVSKSGAFYTTPSKITKDTLVFSVSDGEYTATKKVIIDIKNIAPVFDSLKVDYSTYRGLDSMFSYEAFVGDTLNLSVYARDLDPVADTMKYNWIAGNSIALVPSTQWRAKYKCPLKTAVIDTITSLIADGSDTIKIPVRVSISSRAPIIDSIKTDSATFTGNANTFIDTAAAGDTVEIRVFAHDNDRQDQVSFKWKATNSAQLVAESTSNKVKYICKGISYVDTISVTAMDNYNNSATKTVQLTVEKK